MILRKLISGILLLALVIIPIACATIKARFEAYRNHRGSTRITFNHALHFDKAKGITCQNCHHHGQRSETISAEVAEPLSQPHERCKSENCHDTLKKAAPLPELKFKHDPDMDVANPTKEKCNKCHNWPNPMLKFSIPETYKEVKFSHKKHCNDEEIKCSECHGNVKQSKKITEKLRPTMESCIQCHQKRSAKAIECSLCHKKIDKDYKPMRHLTKLVDHTDITFWKQNHGRAFEYDKVYCQRCHSDNTWCVKCHQDQKPSNHNNTWRLIAHGYQAGWNRENCAVCHQEDFCLRCHRNTIPRSHHGNWSGRTGRHCIKCHFKSRISGHVNCSVCHQTVIHSTAIRSPHPPFREGVCFLCHPLGRPGIAPHITNPGTRCTTCHKRR